MNYLDTVKFDEEKRKYVDAFGYVIEPLKNIRFTEKDNEELEESKDNIITLEGGKTGHGVTVSALLSKDNNVDLFLEPKGTGSSIATSDIVSNFFKENQVRLSSDNANLGIISTEGIDSTVHLDLRAKGAGGELKLHGDMATYLSVSKTPAIKVNSGNPTADLSLQTVGSGSMIQLRNNLARGSLLVKTDTPASTGVTLEASSNQATCNLILQPKSGSYVSVPAPLFTTYGYMLRTHSAIQYVGSALGSAIYVNFDTELQNTFGTGYWTSPDRFKNNSGVTMKVLIQCWAMTESYTTGQLCDMHLKVYNSAASPILGLGRYNVQLTNNSNRYNTLKSEAVVLLGPNESVLWYLYVSGGNIGLMNEAVAPGTLPSGSEWMGMLITQIP